MKNLLLRQELLEQELNCVTGGISKKTKKGLIIGSSVIGGAILLSLIGLVIVMGVRWRAKTQDTTTTPKCITFDQIPEIQLYLNSGKHVSTNNSLFADPEKSFTITPVPGAKITVSPLKYSWVSGVQPVLLNATINGKSVYMSENGRFLVRENGQYQEIDIKQYLEQAASAQPSKECWTSEFQANTHKANTHKANTHK